MGAFELQLRCPQNINGIAADPQPDWSFDNLLHELDSIEQRQNVNIEYPGRFAKTQPRKLRALKDNYTCKRSFVMHVSDQESDSSDADSEEESDTSSGISGKRFACDELYLSDASEDEHFGVQSTPLMDKMGLAECALHELTQEFHLTLSDEVRFNISSLESELVNEDEKFVSMISKSVKDREHQQERDRQFDLQYQRTIAQALDNHLTELQRDHELIYQLEEKRIRDDAAREEARRKEKALQEERMQQERIRAEEEARLKAEKAERAKAAAIEAEKRAAEEAASKRANETLKDTAANALGDSKGNLRPSSNSTSDVKKEVQSSARNVIKASKNALEMEKRRRQVYDEMIAKTEAIKASGNQNYHKHGLSIGRQIRTISATMENIRTKAEDLVNLINSPGCPQPISIQLFVEKIVSNCTNQRGLSAIYAVARVIVLVTSKIPVAMDVLIAELNKICIYTVPKHIIYSEDVFKSKDAYFKAIGYRENGNIESTDDYVDRLGSYMRLYGALVQTEVGPFQNLHGLGEGWAWLARFLNALPANLYTAVALQSFLEMAGFALYRKYRNQFKKLLSIIDRDFLSALKEGGSTKINKVKMSIRNYIESNEYQREPEESKLRDHLESHQFC
ncbi:mRNA export factor GLE1 isoform X2 [Andrographis paniculata]|uniref:mRNA export factor GLE1 isoform X2 n=1 Tax=Andrographis paniculata TaxID=175694 RepID=UPI0021E76F09|nr:mRNA export factor GLE1 isoform X2 [Andrographis paniculata]